MTAKKTKATAAPKKKAVAKKGNVGTIFSMVYEMLKKNPNLTPEEFTAAVKKHFPDSVQSKRPEYLAVYRQRGIKEGILKPVEKKAPAKKKAPPKRKK